MGHLLKFVRLDVGRSRLSVAMGVALLLSAAPGLASAQKVVEIQLFPGTLTLGLGVSGQLLASAFDQRGDNLSDATFTWSSSDPSVARVEEDRSMAGMVNVVPVSLGIVTIEVRAGDQRTSATVQVVGADELAGPGAGVGVATILQVSPNLIFLLPLEDVRVQPRFLTDDGTVAAPVQVTWRSLREDVASITPDGVVVGVSPGQGGIEVTASGLPTARATVRVTQSAFGFATPVLALSPGDVDTVDVIVPEQDSRPLSPRGLAWRSTDISVVTVSPVGVAAAVKAGRAEIVASGFGQENRLSVTVHRPVEFLDVLPRPDKGPVAVPLGGTRTFKATALAEDETPVPEAPLTWGHPDTAIATFDPATGALTGKAIGHTKLTVKPPGEGLDVEWEIDIIAGGLALDANVIGIVKGNQRQLGASFTDEAGTLVSEATSVTWTSSDTSVITVDQQGNVSTVGFGTATIEAATPWGSADTAVFYVQGDVLFTSTRGGNADLYTLNHDDATQIHRVTDLPGFELNAVFSPDGSKIAYVSDQGGNLDIYVIDAGGSNPLRLTQTMALEGSFDWTPDGQRIVYESDAAGSVQLWIMNADGSEQTQLTSGITPNLQPAVSPNGETIAFVTNRDGNFEIYLMDIDGTNQRNLTLSPNSEIVPAWIGDSAFAYVSEERRGGPESRVIIRMNMTRQTANMTPKGLQVTDFAVSADGKLLAVTVAAQGPAGTQNRLYLIPTVAGANPVEVPREGNGDQLVTPSFRR